MDSKNEYKLLFRLSKKTEFLYLGLLSQLLAIEIVFNKKIYTRKKSIRWN